MVKLYKPAEIVAALDEYVIGQDDAKKVLGVAVYNHYKRVGFAASGVSDIEIKKSNVLMVGPTGSGKTLMVTTLAKILDTTFIIGDATAIVASDDVGEEINRLFVKLIDRAGGDIKKAESGIVFVDEIDKLVTGVNRLKGESIQQILLKVIEGTTITIPYNGKEVKLDTNNILFVVGGAFVELAGIVRMRLGERDSILMEDTEVLKQLVADDFAVFGLIPEFTGRLPVIVTLDALSKEALKEALVKPKNSLLSQYEKMFEMEKVELKFDDGAIDKIAELAEGLKTGARGLRTICERFMTNIMYDIPNEQNLSCITITVDAVTGKGKPIYEYNVSREDVELQPIAPKRPRDTNADTDEGEISEHSY